ncbi:glycosyltransferase family 4 protein [Vibrio breoganii]
MANICFFSGDISRSGGTERVGSEIANYLDREKNQVYILSLYGNGAPFFEVNSTIKSEVLFHRKLPFKLIIPLIVMKLRKFICDNNIDIIIDIDSVLSLYSLPSVIFSKTRHITWEHFNYNTTFGMLSRTLARWLAASFSDTIVTLTKQDKDYWVSSRFCRTNVEQIYNPSPFDRSFSNPKDNENRNVLAVGRLTYQKGFDILLEIWSTVEPLNPTWTLTIVGDGEDREHLEKLRKDLKLRNVVFEGFADNVSKYYEKSDIYVMTSRFEGFPMVLLEAASNGLPVVSFDCETGPREMIVNGKTGIVVENKDTNKFALELMTLMKDRSHRYRMSCNSLNEAREYSIERIGPQWSRIINNLASNNAECKQKY